MSPVSVELTHAILLVVAGLLAGILGTAGGITSLISYPALLAIGLPPLGANATNLVALNACWPGSAHGSQRELAGWGPWLRRWLPLTAAGGGTGAVLLLATPAGAFTAVVPFLITAGSLALIAEPWLSGLRPGPPARRDHRPPRGVTGRGRTVLLALVLGLLAVYGGYFGAGSGVLTLALLLFTVERDLPTANALKNMTNGAITLPAGVLLAVFGPVHWLAAAPLALGALVGSRLGPVLTRALPRHVARWGVALLGLGLALWLWARPSA
ncbi:MAG TPA: sulfite exporter TauE/SafE family protein [Solirubrobacteraceae bacterium]|nr:sulfite exporter TauE/SafE family protein [Solirubrobacteraceae bacterium]